MSISQKILNLFCESSEKGGVTPKTAEFAALWWAKFLPMAAKPLELKDEQKLYKASDYGSLGGMLIGLGLDLARSKCEITPEKHDNFVKILTAKILSGKLGFDSKVIHVDYGPPVILWESLDEAGIINGACGGLFPFKTIMFIKERDVYLGVDGENLFHDETVYTENNDSYLCSALKSVLQSSADEL